MSDETVSAAAPAAASARRRNLGWTLLLSYLICLFILGMMVYYGEAGGRGPWAIAANTRVLDLLVKGGIVKLTDIHKGIVLGIPDKRYYVWSQDPIAWPLVFLVVLIYFAVHGMRALQYEWIARYFGVGGSFGQLARAYFYGVGVSLFVPFKAGYVATAAALSAEGQSPERACTAARVQEVFILFEIGIFLLLGLAFEGWRLWLIQTFWPVVLLLVSYALVLGTEGYREESFDSWAAKWTAFKTMAQAPPTLAKVGLIGLASFSLAEICPFIMGQAFTSENVLLVAPFWVVTSGVVGAYIATRIPITPGGIGQWELGFAVTLLASGVGLPEAVAVIFLDGVVRYGTAIFYFFVTKLAYGVKTDLRTVLAIFVSREDVPAWPNGERPVAAPAPGLA